MMDVIQRNLLLDYRERLVADVIQPESLLPPLLSRGILTHEDSNLIQVQVTPQARMRQLLDLLPERGATAFSGLCNALQTHYSWLSEAMRSEGEARISQSQGDEPDFKEGLFLDARLRGGVPSLPPNFVRRQSAVQTVRKLLKALVRCQGLVLHGLTGSGKSCLAAAALDSKELVLSTFKGVVLWVSLGDGILPAQRALLNKLDHHWPATSAIPHPTYVQVPNTEDVAKEALMARILGSPAELRQGLLVLDDVTSEQAVLAFDIGCRLLVLTQDRSVIGNHAANFKVFEMTQGFTEAESLELLASSVNLEPLDLKWPQAREIHHRANGFPLVISLIGGMLAQYKEDARDSSERWQQYSDMLKVTQRSRRNSLSIPGLIITISQSLETLDPTLKMRYYQLVVFDEDVNILPEVLATLWGTCKYEVEDNMMTLVKKSLASRCWNEELRCYVYGVHYLLLHFLQTNLSDQEIKGNHAELVERYQASVHGNWGMLPKDNYAHHFIAQHVVRAGLARSMLPGILLDLGFVAARLKLSLPGDLLRDFQRLRESLDEEDEASAPVLIELAHYESFVRRWGDVVWRRDYLDPIQCALQEPINSKVRHAAFNVISEDGRFFITSRIQMTLQIRRSRDSSSDSGNLEIPGEFSTATLCCRKLLLAYDNGRIQLWDLEYSRSIHDFRGLHSPALKLCVSSDHTKLAAASAMGEVMLWSLPYHTCTCHGGETPTPPPQLRQWCWQPMHGNTAESTAVRLETCADHTPECCIDFADNGELLAWCCLEQIRVWSLANGNPQLLWHIDHLSKATACSFGLGDSVLFLAAGDVSLVGAKSGQILVSLPSNSPSHIAPLRKLVNANYTGGWCFELSGQVLNLWEWWGRVAGGSWSPKVQVLNYGDEAAESHYSSIAITSDQTILGVVSDDSQLLLWQRASLTPLLKVPVSPGRSLLALDCASSTFVRALLGGGGVRSLSVLDLDFDSSPYPLTHPKQPAWGQSGHQHWVAQLYPNGDLRLLCDKRVYVAKKMTSMAAEGHLLAMGTQEGLVATVMPCDLPLVKPCALQRLGSAVTHLKYYQGWLIAATDTLELLVFGHETITECIGLRSNVIESYVVEVNSPWLVVCSTCGLQAWELGWNVAKKGTRVESTAVDVTSEVHDRIIHCAFDASQLIVALAVSQQVQIGHLNFDSVPRFKLFHCIDLPETATALSLLQGGDLLAVAMLSKELLQVWSNKQGSLIAEIEHEAASSIGQIMFLSQDHIISGGAFLAWWQLVSQHQEVDLKLMQVLQMQGQKGTLSFTPNPGSNEILISDGRGSLRVVRPATRNAQSQLNLPFPPPMKESVISLEDESHDNNGTSRQ